MKKNTKRISTAISNSEYELLQTMFSQDSDSAILSSFLSEMCNLIKVELDGLKVFSKEQIDELLFALHEKNLSFNTVQPKHSFLYILKDYYKFEKKTAIDKKLIERIKHLSNLQIIILARFLLTFASNENEEFDYHQAYHFFVEDDEDNLNIMVVDNVCVSDTKKFSEQLKSMIVEKGAKNTDEIKNIIEQLNDKKQK